MQAFTLDGFGAQPALRDIPEPHVGDNELLVRVHASSVNPVDVFIAAGGLKEMAEPQSADCAVAMLSRHPSNSSRIMAEPAR